MVSEENCVRLLECPLERNCFTPLNYIRLGPGKHEDNRTPSCFLLFKKYLGVPDGMYWLKSFDTKVNCTRRGM